MSDRYRLFHEIHAKNRPARLCVDHDIQPSGSPQLTATHHRPISGTRPPRRMQVHPADSSSLLHHAKYRGQTPPTEGFAPPAAFRRRGLTPSSLLQRVLVEKGSGPSSSTGCWRPIARKSEQIWGFGQDAVMSQGYSGISVQLGRMVCPKNQNKRHNRKNRSI